MASPFDIRIPNLFQGQVEARQQAQRDFADKLGQLYAGGNMQAGQSLAGMDAGRADSIRQALEAMPDTEHAKARGKVDLLKKWLYSISQEPDEGSRALLWNQMLGQLSQAGVDISQIEQQYSPQALASHLNETMGIDELFKIDSQRRQGAAGQPADRNPFGTGTEGKIREALDKLSPADPRYAPLLTALTNTKQYNPQTNQYEIGPDPAMLAMYPQPRKPTEEERNRFLADPSMPGWAKEQLSMPQASMRPPVPPTQGQPARAPGELSTESAQDAGLIPKRVVVAPGPAPKQSDEEYVKRQVAIQTESAAAKQKIENQGKLRTAKIDFSNMRQWLTDLKKAVTKHGVSPIPNPEVQSAWSQALVNYNAKIAELGALAGPDKMMLDQILTDPSSARGIYYGKDGILGQINDALKRVDSMEGYATKQLSGDQGEPAKPTAKRIRIDANGNVIQ